MSVCRRIYRVKQVENDTVGIEYETDLHVGIEMFLGSSAAVQSRPMCLLRAPQETDSGGGGYDLAYALAQRCLALEAELATLRFGLTAPMIDNLSKPARPLDPDFNPSP